MQLTLKTWNSININDGTTFESWFPVGQLVNLRAEGITVPRAIEFPFLSTTVLQDHVIVINIKVLPGQVIPTQREIIKRVFNIQDRQRHNLVAEDVLDGNRQWYLTGIPIRVNEQSAGIYSVSIQVEMPVWRVVTALTDTWNITATGQTRNITNLGNVNVAPKFTITPTVAKTGGFQYRRWIAIENQMTKSFVFPFDALNQMDTAAVVGAAKMQADGDDLRFFMNGEFADRWLGNMNSATTKGWLNLTMQSKQVGVTSVSIDGVTSITTITLAKTRANLRFLQALKRAVNKVVMIDNEAFTFTSVDLVAYQITGVARAKKGTSMAAHAAPSNVRWIENELWLVYGDSSVTAPDTDDARKPLFDLTSTNALLAWSVFDDNDSARPGGWHGEVRVTRGGLSYVFTGPENTFVNPATYMGLALIGFVDQEIPKGETGTIGWQFFHPCGIDTVSWWAKKYTTNLLSWCEVVGLQVLQPDAEWFTLQNEAVPINPLVWQLSPFGGVTPNTYNLSALGLDTIRFALDGSIRAEPNSFLMAEFYDVDVVPHAANLPAYYRTAEQSCYYFDFKLSNNITGEYLTAQLPLGLNEPFVIDCEQKIAYLQDGTRIPVTLSTERDAWLNLAPGANTLQFDDTGTNAVTVVTDHRDRTM